MNSTAPLDINTSTSSACSVRCAYWYNYGNSTCNIANNKDHLSIKYDGQSDVVYNTSKYTPTEVKLFKPALHTFDDVKADAELIIVHSNPEGNLLVCVPIMSSNSNTTNALSEIITAAPQQSDEPKVLSINDFNLNNVIPKSSYYSYNGSNAWDSTNTSYYNYIVFQQPNTILLKAEVLASLGKLISEASVNQVPGTSYYNNSGTTKNGFQGDGQIYIDCQPTGESGEIIYKDSPIGKPNVDVDFKKTQEILLGMLSVIIGMVLIYVLYKIVFGILDFSGSSQLMNIGNFFGRTTSKIHVKIGTPK